MKAAAGISEKGTSWLKTSGAIGKTWAASVVTVALAGIVLATTSVAALAEVHRGAVHRLTTTASKSTSMGVVSGSASPGTSIQTSPVASTMSGMSGMSAISGMSGMSGMSGSSSTGLICPNVTGATVMGDGMEMAPVPPGPPTPAQQAAANELVAQTTADIQKYADVASAEAAGYKPVTSGRGPETHYANYSLVGPRNVLNPEAPPSLMYANTVKGPVLVGAMYFGPGPCQPGPDIGGPLTDWHAHANLCTQGGVVVGRTGATGSCAIGTHSAETLFMLHVWTAPQLAAQYQFQADVPASAFTQIIETGQA